MAARKCPPACGSVTPPRCPSEGEKGTGYELCSNCMCSADAGRVRVRRMRCKFYLMAKEGFSFEKYVVFCKLEAAMMFTWAMHTKLLRQLSYSHVTSWNSNFSSSFKPSLTNRPWLIFCSEVTWPTSYNHSSVTENAVCIYTILVRVSG